MSSCDCALHLVFMLFICSSVIVWVSIDSGVEVNPTYPPTPTSSTTRPGSKARDNLTFLASSTLETIKTRKGGYSASQILNAKNRDFV